MGSIRSDGCQNTEFELLLQQSEALNRTRVLYECFMRGKHRIGFNEAFFTQIAINPDIPSSHNNPATTREINKRQKML